MSNGTGVRLKAVERCWSSLWTTSSKLCAIERRVCERKSDGPEFGVSCHTQSIHPTKTHLSHAQATKQTITLKSRVVSTPRTVHLALSSSAINPHLSKHG